MIAGVFPTKRGFQLWETTLFLFFLSIAGGASVFFFFLSSRDVKTSQNQAFWARNIHSVFDQISDQLANAAQIEHPFEGESKECFFRKFSPGRAMEPSLELQGFIFSEGGLSNIIKTASGTNLPVSFHGFSNPLITGILNGKFERKGTRLLKISAKISPPLSHDSSQIFERWIFLRNP